MSRTLFSVLLMTLYFAQPVDAARQKTLATWERCQKTAIAATVRQAAREGHPESYYFGAGGAGAIVVVRDACGPKPSLNTLPADERAVLAKWCQRGDFASLPSAAERTFWPYGKGSPHWNLAATECDRIYAVHAGKQHATNVAQALAIYERWIEFCADTGNITDRLVSMREQGIPLTSILQLQAGADAPNLQRWIHDVAVEVYGKRYWSATIARQEIESRCMAKAPR